MRERESRTKMRFFFKSKTGILDFWDVYVIKRVWFSSRSRKLPGESASYKQWDEAEEGCGEKYQFERIRGGTRPRGRQGAVETLLAVK